MQQRRSIYTITLREIFTWMADSLARSLALVITNRSDPVFKRPNAK
ncbi:MAG: hypothetical protein V3Q69_11735 [Burkholderia sp.]